LSGDRSIPTIDVVIVTGSGDRAFSVGADVNAWTPLG